ncbi:LuxE family acyl-protein synthetase [Photorhabdus luminescens]|nr:LuxE family acyl-protein synthetase [Photorhabdus luminescens]PQQ41793.1 LuxE family acyl-protein synthetase [Photorhabdus luminescens]
MENIKNIYDGIKSRGGNPLKWLIADVDLLYKLSKEEQQELKTCLLKDAFHFHYHNNPYYRDICEKQGIKPEEIQNYNDLVRIPLIPVATYKSAESHRLLSKPLSEIEHEMRSTGTSGIPSVYRRCHDTMDHTVLAVYSNYRSMFKVSGGAGLCLCPSTEDIPEMALVKIFNFLTGLLDTRRYMINQDRFSPEDSLNQLIQWKGKFTRHLIGPPFMIHRFITFLKENNTKLTLDRDSMVITMGGWKRFTGDMISRSELNADIEEWLGIPASRTRDMYGLVEANLLAIEDEYNHKHVPPYIHFSVRDPNNLTRELPDGETGQLVILDPLSVSTPGMLLTEDLVYLRTDPNKSWRNSQRVQFVMRTAAAKEFGCCAVNLERKMSDDEGTSATPAV